MIRAQVLVSEPVKAKMPSTTQTASTPGLPWMATTVTGWAAKQRQTATRCEVCDYDLAACAGCAAPRCLACDPYKSDDCRWPL